MKRAYAAACIVVLVLLAPTALAAQGLVSEQLIIAGTTRLEGDAAALFFLSTENGFSWEASADSATLVREYATYQAVAWPTRDPYVAFLPTAWETETTMYDSMVTVASTRTIEWGAMLILSESAAVRASSEGLVDVRAASDPHLGQITPSEADGGDGGEISHTFDGEYLNATFAQGVYTLTGDLTLLMYGPAYSIASDGATSEWETGEFETTRTGVYVDGRQERHTLTLHDAVLQLRALEPTTILTTFPTLDFDGTLKAPRPEGALVVGGATIAAPSDGTPLTYRGAARLTLAFDAGRVSAAGTPDAAISTAGAIAPQGPPLLAMGAGVVLLVAALVGAVVLWARRDREDDLALALLAMEERRWDDALPRLTRVARRQPDNVGVLIDRALCLEQVGRFDEAARTFEGALRNAPGLAEAHFYYARTLAKMRQPDAARAHLEEALERDPRLVEMVRGETVLRGL